MYATIIPDAKMQTGILVFREKVTLNSIGYTDTFQVYDVLDVSEFHHPRVNHSTTFVSKRGHLLNGIENFWDQAALAYIGLNPGITLRSIELSYISP